MIRLIKAIYFESRFYYAIIAIVSLFVLAYNFDIMFFFVKLIFYAFVVLFFVEIFRLFNKSIKINARREVPEKLSNGDENKIIINIENEIPPDLKLQILDEIPNQFQVRDFLIKDELKAGTNVSFDYYLMPKKRGEYIFHDINLFLSTKLGLISRRIIIKQSQSVAVYPSFLQMRKYQILALNEKVQLQGLKKIRKRGNTFEFEQIRDYVVGDDYRSINWKASARRGDLMVNQYQDEISQNIVCLIDKSRNMRMPFDGMTLLDYSINSSLILLNIALLKSDKAGLLTFQRNIDTYLAPNSKKNQMNLILEKLYKETTDFGESDYEKLYMTLNSALRQRSLLILFTNFESFSGMQRQINYLKMLAKRHLLVVVFFKNTELKELISSKPEKVAEIYRKTVAEKMTHEKRVTIKELNRNGIQTIFTKPIDLTANTLNKYLEIKARRVL